jgi:hypothetical protein
MSEAIHSLGHGLLADLGRDLGTQVYMNQSRSSWDPKWTSRSARILMS